MDKSALAMLVRLMIKEFGVVNVQEAIGHQVNIDTVDYLIGMMRLGDASPKIHRIKIVRKLGIVTGLREAKYYVEDHWPDNSAG